MAPIAPIRVDHPFSLTRGGPFYHLMQRCHLVDARGRTRWSYLALIAWLPVVLASLVKAALGGGADTIFYDPAVHERFLVALPLLVFAEHLLDRRCEVAAGHLAKEGIVERTNLNVILDRAERLRDSRLVEGVLAFIVLALGQVAWWHFSGASGFVQGLDVGVRSFATLWYTVFALPFVQFMLLRWLWRWALWTYVLVRLARLPLSTNAIHPDEAAGLRVLSAPIDAFTVFVTAVTSVTGVAWATNIYFKKSSLESFSPTFFVFAVIATALACGPLLAFVGHLYRARVRDAAAYHVLAREYVDTFRRKWLTDRTGDESPVGSSDIQSLNDLGGSWNTADNTKLVPFGVRTVVMLWVAAIVPMIPAVLAAMPVSELAKRLGKMALGF